MNLLGVIYFFHFLWAVPVIFFSKTTQGSNISQFEVHSLPGIHSLPTSWAGQLPVPGIETGNRIFFWLFETENKLYDDNLISQSLLNSQNQQIKNDYFANVLYSLAQWRAWLLVLNWNGYRKWSHLIRRKYN